MNASKYSTVQPVPRENAVAWARFIHGIREQRRKAKRMAGKIKRRNGRHARELPLFMEINASRG